MRKLIFILLLCLVSLSNGQFAPEQKPVLGNWINWGNPLSNSLVGYWLMNEGGGNKVYDSSGNRNNGTLSGPDWIAGKFGPALDINSGDVITVPNSAVLNITAKLSLCAWVKIEVIPGASETYGVICKASNIATDEVQYSWTIGQFGPSDSLLNFVYKSGGSWYPHVSTSALGLNVWYHIVATYDGTNVKIYINGVLDNTIGAGTSTLSTSSHDVLFGTSRTDGYYAEDLQIDNTCIFNYALSAFEVAQLYSDPFGMLRPSFNLFLYGGISIVTVGSQVIFINMN